MSHMLQVRIMAALLRQGRVPAVVSTLLGATALALLCLPPMTLLSTLLVALSLLVGAVQAYYAVRVGFDQALLEAFAATQADDAPAPIDAALEALSLRRADKVSRDWPARWRGMRALLRGQLLALAVQAITLMPALWLRWRYPDAG
ncbi:hypothetical protein [Stenotrophomonas sp. PD6]|uniref:hypothetical protein n=1 Tax=Stenotrophomonas sp. PD6 TaxID=3368612 RepID=UPI003BA0110F